MNPRSGENPPVSRSSRSQSCRAVRSHDGHSVECAFSSAAFSESTSKLISSLPWGATKWAVAAVNLASSFSDDVLIKKQARVLEFLGREKRLDLYSALMRSGRTGLHFLDGK